MAEVTFPEEGLFKGEGGGAKRVTTFISEVFLLKNQTNRPGVEQSLHATVNILVPMNPALHKVTAPGVSTANPSVSQSPCTHRLRED